VININGDGDHDLSAIVTELIGLADSGPPAAGMVAHAFAARATRQDTALRRPNDIVLTLRGDVATMTIWEDTRGWGAYTALNVTKGSLADLGASSARPRQWRATPTTSTRRDPCCLRPEGGKTIRVFAELDKQDHAQLRRVTIHFQR